MTENSHKPPHKPKWAAVITAAGSGERTGFAQPKQYHKLAFGDRYESVLAQSMRRLLPFADIIQPVIAAEHATLYEESTKHLRDDKILPPVFGGARRQESVYCGLRALAERSPDFVMIHDAARPFVSADIIAAVKEQAETDGGAVPVIASGDSVCVASPKTNSKIANYLQRSELALVQTPQAFAFGDILAAHEAAANKATHYDDDAALLMANGTGDIKIGTVSGSHENIKLTQAADFRLRSEAPKAAAFEFRSASAFDVHAFGSGDAVRLGGVSLPYERGLSGHSDADVVLHALCDAMLAAAGEADIGHHFPPSDSRWQDADSAEFIQFAYDKLQAQAMQMTFADVTIICEAPKIAPHREAMIENLARLLGLRQSQIAVKATTTEKLGFLGRGEGIAAWAVISVKVPVSNEY